MELQVLQLQTGDAGSGTEAQNLNRFIGCFRPHHCQKGRKEEAEQQQYKGQQCGRWRESHPGMVGASIEAAVVQPIPGGVPADRKGKTGSYLAGKQPLLYLRQG